MANELLTIEQVAEKLGISHFTIRSWIGRKQWPADLKLINISPSPTTPRYRITEASVATFIRKRVVKP